MRKSHTCGHRPLRGKEGSRITAPPPQPPNYHQGGISKATDHKAGPNLLPETLMR